MRTVRSALGCFLSVGCTACHLGQVLDVVPLHDARAPELTAAAPLRMPGRTRVVERTIELGAHHVDADVSLGDAQLRVVEGSTCAVASPAICPARRACLATVALAGEVCVLHVQPTSEAGHELAPYCFDLSHPRLTEAAARDDDGHPTWESCLEQTSPAPRAGHARGAAAPHA
jgi:hypothetical protein